MKKSLYLLLIVQFIIVSHFFCPLEIFNSDPIINDDFPIHQNQVSTNLFLVKDYNFLDYNFIGGRLVVGSTRKLQALAFYSLAIPGINEIILFKLYFFLINLFAPFFIFIASKNFLLNKRACIISLILGIIGWNFSSIIHPLTYYGLFPFLFFILLTLLGISYFFKFYITNKQPSFWLALMFFIYSYLVHAHYFVITIPLIGLLLFIRGKRKGPFNNIILISFLGFSAFTITNVFLILLKNPFISGLQLFHQGKGLIELLANIQNFPMYVFVCLLGFSYCFISKDKRFKFVFLSLGSLFLIAGYFGNYLPFSAFQFQRAIYFLFIFMLIPAAAMLDLIISKKSWKLLAILILVIIIVFMVSDYSLQAQTKLKLTTKNPYPDLIGHLSTPGAGRLLIENSGFKTGHVYGGHINYLFPKFTDRELAGENFPYKPLTDNNFIGDLSEGRFHGQSVSNYSCEELDRGMSLVNVQTIVAWNETTKTKLESCQSFFTEIASIAPFKVFEVKNKSTNFLIGSGTIQNKVTKLQVNSSSNQVVLKYRYHPCLRTKPELIVEPYSVIFTENINATFILIKNKGQNFIINC